MRSRSSAKNKSVYSTVRGRIKGTACADIQHNSMAGVGSNFRCK